MQHVELNLTYVTPEGFKRTASVPAQAARVDPGDIVSALSLMVIALHDRIAALEVVPDPTFVTMDSAPEPTQEEIDWGHEVDARMRLETGEEEPDLFDAIAPVDSIDV
jgi:hypothetical protein